MTEQPSLTDPIEQEVPEEEIGEDPAQEAPVPVKTEEAPVSHHDPLPAQKHNEAGGIAWCEIFTSTGVKINLTSRADTPEQALGELIHTIITAKQRFGIEPHPVKVAPAPAKPAGSAVPPHVAGTSAPRPVSSTSAPATPAGDQPKEGDFGPSFVATRLQFAKRDGGKVDVKLFSGNHKFPDVTAVRTYDSALKMLQNTGDAWDITHFDMTDEFECNYKVDWVYGAFNSKGNRYKNVVKLSAVA